MSFFYCEITKEIFKIQYFKKTQKSYHLVKEAMHEIHNEYNETTLLKPSSIEIWYNLFLNSLSLPSGKKHKLVVSIPFLNNIPKERKPFFLFQWSLCFNKHMFTIVSILPHSVPIELNDAPPLLYIPEEYGLFLPPNKKPYAHILFLIIGIIILIGVLYYSSVKLGCIKNQLVEQLMSLKQTETTQAHLIKDYSFNITLEKTLNKIIPSSKKNLSQFMCTLADFLPSSSYLTNLSFQKVKGGGQYAFEAEGYTSTISHLLKGLEILKEKESISVTSSFSKEENDQNNLIRFKIQGFLQISSK